MAVFTPSVALTRLGSLVPPHELGRVEVLKLCEWLVAWNKTLQPSAAFFGYDRDTAKTTTGYCIHENRQGKGWRYFLIVKLKGTDFNAIFKGFHLEFRLPKDFTHGYGNRLVQRREKDKAGVIVGLPNWIIQGSDLSTFSHSQLVELTRIAYQESSV